MPKNVNHKVVTYKAKKSNMSNNSTHTMRVLDKDMNVIIEREYTRPAVCHATTLHRQSKRSMCDRSKLIVSNPNV